MIDFIEWIGENMGKYLDQCCKDAWDVIRGRKKIVGNRIVNIEVAEEIENKNKEVYGWLAPDGHSILWSLEIIRHGLPNIF